MTTLDIRLKRADVVIYLDFNRLLCILRAFKRPVTAASNLFHSGCAPMLNWMLFKYIWAFKREKGVAIEKLRKQYPHIAFQVLKEVY